MSRLVRLLTLMLAAMQFAAPAVVAVADGAFAKVIRDPRMHVETRGANDCTPPHAADCTVCRYLSDNLGTASGPPVGELSATSQFVPCAPSGAVFGFADWGFTPRGPPAIAG